MLQRTMITRDSFHSPARFRTRAAFGAGVALLAFTVAGAARAEAVVTEVSAPSPGTYDRTLALHFTATFSAPVTVQGAPRLKLRVGDEVRHATWTPPLGPAVAVTSIAFVYHPEPLDRDVDGITIVPQLDLNGGSIESADSSPVKLAFAPPDTRGICVMQRPPPTPRVLGLTPGGEVNPAPVATGDGFALRGTADGHSRVSVDLVDVGIIGSTTAAANGAWSMPYPASLLSPGTHRLVATAESPAGLASEPSAPLELSVTTAPPPAAP